MKAKKDLLKKYLFYTRYWSGLAISMFVLCAVCIGSMLYFPQPFKAVFALAAMAIGVIGVLYFAVSLQFKILQYLEVLCRGMKSKEE